MLVTPILYRGSATDMDYGFRLQHAFVENERAETLETAIVQFKRVNRAWTKTQCIVVDKDFTEIAVLERQFPQARILLCQFHVLDYLHREITKSMYQLSSEVRTRLKASVKRSIYAQNKGQYDDEMQYMLSQLDNPSHRFMVYYQKNWDSCKERWVSYQTR